VAVFNEIVIDNGVQAVVFVIKIIIKSRPDDSGLVADLLDRDFFKEMMLHQKTEVFEQIGFHHPFMIFHRHLMMA
jgi:hypothetical protein